MRREVVAAGLDQQQFGMELTVELLQASRFAEMSSRMPHAGSHRSPPPDALRGERLVRMRTRRPRA